MTSHHRPLRSPAHRPILTIASALLALLPFLGGRAYAQTEATPQTTPPAEAASATEAAPAPAKDVAETPPAKEASKTPPAPAGATKCECPPPCPAPPPPPPPSAVQWNAQSKGGMLVTTGNSQSKNFTFGVNASRKEGNNKLTLDGGLAYGTSDVVVADLNSSNQIQSIHREQIVSTNNWSAKGRYDRFVTVHNTFYASAQAAADKIAGKTFYGGGQIGYSRELLKNKWNVVVAEVGYDLSYERYVQPADATLDPVTIHSARVLVGEALTLTKETGLTASVEALFNLNKETKALDVNTGNPGVNAFKDTRVNGKLALSTNLYKQLSFGFSFSIKYDQNPAPLPMPAGVPAGATLASNFSLGFAQKVDTSTEATLIYTFF